MLSPNYVQRTQILRENAVHAKYVADKTTNMLYGKFG